MSFLSLFFNTFLTSTMWSLVNYVFFHHFVFLSLYFLYSVSFTSYFIVYIWVNILVNLLYTYLISWVLVSNNLIYFCSRLMYDRCLLGTDPSFCFTIFIFLHFIYITRLSFVFFRPHQCDYNKVCLKSCF